MNTLKLQNFYTRLLRGLVFGLIVVAGVGVFVMIGATCLDVVLRKCFGHSIKGAVDIVKMAGAISLAAALPYTTAVKGHVAIEYFFHKLNRIGRIIVDSICRLLGISLFIFLGWQCILYGNRFLATGQVSQTLELPVFWLPWVIGFCCFVSALVIVYNLIHPGREMIKP